MASIKPSVPKGTRDFSPAEMAKRNFIFDTIKSVFRKYGYQQIETPSMENRDTLMGKYGDEGDKLIFNILESGEYTASVNEDLLGKFNDVIIENETIEIFKKIANEFADQISVLNKQELEKEYYLLFDYLTRKMHSDYFVIHAKRPQYYLTIKNAFVKYLLSKGTTEKFRRYKNRLTYYFSLQDSNFRQSEIRNGFNYLIKNQSTLNNIIKSEALITKQLNPTNISSLISKKALRYDLTVPFARYVVMHQNEITFPFKRFQVQPVWRADRPQKGRYREFYQCDADVVGSPSLLNEAEFVLIYDEALSKLGLKDFSIKINNRKILSGIAEVVNKADQIVDMTVAIDKLDKIGLEGVSKELLERGFTEENIEQIKPIILLEGTTEEKLASLRSVLANSDVGLKGCEELETVFNYLKSFTMQNGKIELDITLARGLNYYTGAIFEVKTNEVQMGSIGGGGRYDDLTGMFGLKDLTGVGISFGADRIYDVLEELKLFPEATSQSTQVLICPFDAEGEAYALPLLQQLRNKGINTELYPAGAKIKKQLDYANNKAIPTVIIIGGDEMATGQLTVKDMVNGTQQKLTVPQIITKL